MIPKLKIFSVQIDSFKIVEGAYESHNQMFLYDPMYADYGFEMIVLIDLIGIGSIIDDQVVRCV